MSPTYSNHERMARQFSIDLDNRPDTLGDVLLGLAEHNVDLRTVAVTDVGRKMSAVFITNDDAATCEVLRAQHLRFTAGEIVITSVPDEPGALAHLVRQISAAGIRLHGLSLLRWHQGKAELALSADNPLQLQRLLASYQRGRVGVFAAVG